MDVKDVATSGRDLESGELLASLASNGYYLVKVAADGSLIALHDYLFTTGLVIGMSDMTHKGRYCYASRGEAAAAIASWDGVGVPPGMWIKYKGVDGERLGPGASEG